MNYRLFIIIFLGVFFGFGPLLTDMYLPAFPQLQSMFGTSASMVQMSLSSCMLGLMIGQVIWGPLSDKYGRKPIIRLSLLLFMFSCLGCLFSPNIEFLVVMRLLQGVGGSGGLVLSRSIAADLYSGKDLMRLMALIGAVNGIAPVTAPVVGGLLTDSAGWRAIFGVLLGIGVMLVVASFIYRESLSVDRRTNVGLSKSISSYVELLSNKRYVWSILQYGCLHGFFFTYLASSTFILQDHYGFSATQYSLLFAVNASTVGIASLLSIRFSSPARCTFVASVLLCLLCLAVSCVLFTDGNVWLYEGCTLVQVFCCGLCFASTPTLAMDLQRSHAGVAAALLGVFTYAVGFLVTPLVGLGNTLHTTGIIYSLSALLTLYFAYRLYREEPSNS